MHQRSHMEKSHVKNVIDKIMYLYQKHGEESYFGEKVTQTQHAFQSLHLAQMLSDDEEVQLAAFLHDIGHLCEDENLSNGMVGYGIINHESEGARYLMELGFSNRICQLVEHHVMAKRYLVSGDPLYFDGLSEASKKTLEFQGGRLSHEELLDFEACSDFDNYILLRKCDDLGKSANMEMESWEGIKALISRHLKNELYKKTVTSS